VPFILHCLQRNTAPKQPCKKKQIDGNEKIEGPMKIENELSPSNLRQKAEEILNKKKSETACYPTESQYAEVIRELEVYQIELELQNEALRHLWAKTEVINDKYTGLFDFTPTGYFMLSLEGKIIELNLSGANMLGKERLRLKNSRFIGFISDETKPIFNIFLADVFNHKTKESCEVNLSVMENRPLYVHLNGIVSENEEQCLLTVVDITERKRLEEALFASQQITEDIINSIPVRVFWKDKNLIFRGCNKIFANDAGYDDPQEIIGKNDFMMAWRDQAELYRADDRHVIEHNSAKLLIEEPQTTPGGNIITLLTSKIPMHNSAGEVIGILGTYMDITERKKSLDLLSQTRLNYETFFNTIDEFLLVLDEEGNILHTNKTVIDRLGYSKEELFGKSVLMLHPPERREEAGRIVAEMTQGLADFCPVPIMTKSGIQIPVETRISQGFWDGNPVIFGVTKNISKIRLSEEKFSKLFHINRSACGLSDLDDHTYVEVNDAFYRLFGFTGNEVIGKTARELGIMTEEIAQSILQHADEHGTIINAEADLKTKNGDIKHVLLSAENFYVQDKRYRFTVVHDMTEFKQAETALRESEKRYHAFYDAIPDMIFRMNREGVFLDYKAEKDDLYHQSETLIGKRNRDVTPHEFGDLIDRKIRETLETGRFEHFTYQMDLPGKGLRDFEARMVPSGNDEVIVLTRDITDRIRDDNNIRLLNETLEKSVSDRTRELELKNFELALQNEEKQKRADELVIINRELEFQLNEIEQVNYIASHDLQEPLLTLTNNTQLLRSEFAGKLDSDGNKFIDFITDSANRMKDLVRDFADYSLLRKEHVMSFVDCNKIVADILIELAGSIAENKVSVTSGELPSLQGFAVELQILFKNLLINAIKFRKPGIPPEISITAEFHLNEYIFSVKDNGIGIEEKDKEKIFIVFGQMHTGIGLEHCKKIIELHGGKIWVESLKEVGTTFKFTIPVSS